VSLGVGNCNMQIKEIIVVEGFHDKQAVERAVKADVWVTGGAAVSEPLLQELVRAQKTRGVIVFTDPDGEGERIRRRIGQRVPGCKHAFLPSHEAEKKGDIGIEHAAPERIRQALQKVRTEWEEPTPRIAWEVMLRMGLTGIPGAASRRSKLAERLGVGYGNGKAFWRKLNRLGVTCEELEQAYRQLKEEDPEWND
jgi:ribonuclease M5